MKKLLILSGKGGTGKTTAASAFIHFSKAEAFADCDVDAPNLHLALNFQGVPQKKDFLGGQKAHIEPSSCTSCGECIRHCRFHAIQLQNGFPTVNEISCEGCGVCEYVCPADAVSLKDDIAGFLSLYTEDTVFSTAELKMGRGNSGKLVTEVKFSLFEAAADKPLAVIDGSPGIGCPVIASISGIDLVLIVAEPTVSGISDLKRLIKTASVLHSKVAVCVNKWDTSEEQTETIQQFCRENHISFAGKIPFDKTVAKAINQGKNPADIDSPARDALYRVYCNVSALLEEET